MPTYDYTCGACKVEMELIHSMSTTRKKCPECGAIKLKRQIGVPAFHAHYSPMHPRAGRGRGGSQGLPGA